MPLPFILVGGAFIFGAYGVKNGVDASSDFGDATETNNKAQRIYDRAFDELDTSRLHAENSMKSLGVIKFEIYEKSIIPFVETFTKIKNINFEDNKIADGNLPQVNFTEMKEMQSSNVELKELVGGGISSLGAGGLAGLAAYGGVGLLGTASTGTAIGSLSGVAATNAALAWLGGGSLATGGLGMAGGMFVLGGIVAGPVLAVGGKMMASKAEAAKEDAYANLSKSKLAAEEMETASEVTKGIKKRFDEVNGVLATLNNPFIPFLESLDELVERNDNYETYSEEDKKGVFITASLAKTLKNILEVNILNEEGTPTGISEKVVEKSKLLIKEEEYQNTSIKKPVVSLESIFEKYEWEDDIHNGSSLYIGWRAPYKKIQNAIDSYAYEGDDEEEYKCPPDASLLVFYDHTIFGSADEGFYLTEDELYAIDYSKDRVHIKLKEIKERVRVDEDDNEIKIGGNYIPYDSDLDRSMNIIADCINSYIEQF